MLLTAGSRGVSTLGLDGPVVSAHLTTVVGTEAGAGVSSLLSVEVLLSGHSGESMRLSSASSLGGGSSSLLFTTKLDTEFIFRPNQQDLYVFERVAKLKLTLLLVVDNFYSPLFPLNIDNN